MTVEVKPEGETEVKPIEGDGDELDKYFGDPPKKDESEPNPDDVALESYNKKVGKNYKSWDEVTKREKDMDTAFARKEVEPEEIKPTVQPQADITVQEISLKVDEPLSRYVLEDMKKVAKTTGKTLTELWDDESGYFKGKAQLMEQKKKSKERISTPSPLEGEEEDSEEKKMSQKFMKNFPPGIKIPKLNK